MYRHPVFAHPRAATLRAIGFALVWLILVGPDAASWIIGGPFVVAATLASLRLSKPRERNLSVSSLAGFIPYFLVESLRGGLDVAARVLLPRLRVQPGNQEYRVSLRSPEARLVFIDSISLLPGTLSADLRGDLVTVHALDVRTDVVEGLTTLERRVAALFGESLPPASDRTIARTTAGRSPADETSARETPSHPEGRP
ncbi:Na+/H+ antiporter subunit E [Thiocapsa roseopersicina]|uniref:Multicomponent Na+:H+ antiporter subunit E n=1 Tax=Thiocapsa roseopersicina TaxID=1058 RepID=A0A1H3ATV1_THIRO|nr:Na+/H+ antiporter subunit E [Thiocapsa roseopersicina]SDX33142.1 multicomponent Na+:H+ antiporter subunit E [Thiocapsa roseopersicina]